MFMFLKFLNQFLVQQTKIESLQIGKQFLSIKLWFWKARKRRMSGQLFPIWNTLKISEICIKNPACENRQLENTQS